MKRKAAKISIKQQKRKREESSVSDEEEPQAKRMGREESEFNEFADYEPPSLKCLMKKIGCKVCDLFSGKINRVWKQLILDTGC